MRPAFVRITAAGVLLVPLLVASQPGAAAAAPAPDPLAAAVKRQLAAGVQVAPKQAPGAKLAPAGANPYLALLADPTTVDYSTWSAVAQSQGATRAARMDASSLAAAAVPPLVHDEAEPAGTFGSNDSVLTAELVKGLGTGRGENQRSRVLGQFSPQVVAVSALTAFAEDDGAIPLAGDTGISALRRGARLSATIGDGPHGSTGDASGDFDFLKVTATAGQEITGQTATPTGPLDTVLGLYDSAGTLIATNDDSVGLDSLLRFQVTTSGTYFLLVSGFGFGTVFPADPFDSGSGIGTGSQGPYDLTVTVAAPDRDFYAVDLDGGDVLGASVKGTGNLLSVRDPDGNLMMRSDQDASFIYSPNAPLPGGGNAVADAVAPTTGQYTLEIGGTAGSYDVTLEVYRPGPEATPQGTTQAVYLDFDGARVNTAIWGGPGVRDLSPLTGFLGKWGLSASQENAVINATIAAVRENLVADIRASAVNQRAGLRILNSRDNPDAFGQPNVHRVIVGGTIAQSGIGTIGIAQFIDPGNYSTDDSALVLLDVLSDPTGAASLNTYITPASQKIEFIGRALGNVISHEMGHMLGNFHTDTFNDVPSLMDAGGNFPGLFGVGPDNIGGTADDVDYDFAPDALFPNEGFAGTEDTLNVVGWALVKGKVRNTL